MISIMDIQTSVASYYGITPEELSGPNRDKEACARRIVAYKLCLELTDANFPELGATFGGRDYSTVLGASRRKLDLPHQIALEDIRAQLTSGAAYLNHVVRMWPFRCLLYTSDAADE